MEDVIIERTGLPDRDRGFNIITLIVDASTDKIRSLSGKLGTIRGVTVKSTLAKV